MDVQSKIRLIDMYKHKTLPLTKALGSWKPEIAIVEQECHNEMWLIRPVYLGYVVYQVLSSDANMESQGFFDSK